MARHSSRRSLPGVLFVLTGWVALLVVLGGYTGAEELRTWTDSTGRHKMEGKYAGMAGSKVKLELKTGKKMEIELKKLSEADQKYVADLDAENPFKPEEDNPFQPAAGGGKAMAPGQVQGNVTVDWTKSDAILLEAPDEWKAEVAPHPGFAVSPKSVALPPKIDFFEKTAGLVANAVSQQAVVCFRLGRDEKDSNVRLVKCDLKTGKSTGIATAQALVSPIALHDDGKQVLMRHDGFGSGNQETLELWTIQGQSVQKTLSWMPYDEQWKPNRDVSWAEFVDAGHLLTCSRAGKVAMWDLSTAQPLWHFETANGATPCLSGDRKLIGFCSADKVGLFDIASRKFVGLSSTPGTLTWPITAFSPSGKRLACIAQSRILVWDTATGKLLCDFEAPGLHLTGAIGFPDDNFLLGGNRFMIDLQNQLKLWEYSGAEQMVHIGKHTLAGLGTHNAPGALLSLELPHKDARDLLNKALTQPDLFVFREGTSVKLDVAGIPAADQAHVREVLTKKLTDMKCPVADTGTISLVAVVVGPKEREVSYMHSGDYKVQEYFTQLHFMYQGTPAWTASSTNIPFMLSLKRGENIEGVLRKLSEKPNTSFYDGVILPKFLQKPTAGQGGAASRQTLGGSQILTSGLK
jgi:SLA1 homology domain 1, SHD1